MREKLATIQKILEVKPIEGADNIEAITILGWHLVAKKSEFKVGDKAVFIEVDSVLPADKEWAQFMHLRKYRVKTAKFLGMISQGLALPLSILPMRSLSYIEGDDVTDLLEIKHYESLTPEKKESVDTQKRSKLKKFLMRYSWYRKYFLKSFKGDFPEFFHKTDEERLQNCPEYLNYKDPVYYSEKLDGQNGNYFIKRKSFCNNVFGVCSRNIYQKSKCNSHYWTIAEQLNIKNKLIRAQKFYKTDLVIQGEIIGTGVQKNKYNLKGLDFYIFNVFDIKKQKYFTLVDMWAFCNLYDFKIVPILNDVFKPLTLPDSVDEMVEQSKGLSVVNPKIKREGIVVRSRNGKELSFKVINPEFLLKWQE